MATNVMSVERASRLRPKYVLFALFALMGIVVLYNNERFLIDRAAPIWQHYEPFKWWLLLHGVFGTFALLLGPLQFSERMRQRHIGFHRVSGRIYGIGVLVCAPLGYYIQHLHGPMVFNMAAAVQATNWFLTTAIALYFVKTGNIQQHRQWMTRSFAVALIFLEVRVIDFLLPGPGSLERVMAIVWICNGFSIIAADIVIQAEAMLGKRRSRPVAMRAAAAS